MNVSPAPIVLIDISERILRCIVMDEKLTRQLENPEECMQNHGKSDPYVYLGSKLPLDPMCNIAMFWRKSAFLLILDNSIPDHTPWVLLRPGHEGILQQTCIHFPIDN